MGWARHRVAGPPRGADRRATTAAHGARHVNALGMATGDARFRPSHLAWTGRLPGAGILTFAPWAAIDAYNALELKTDADGRRGYGGFNANRFLADSARSQSGNAMGFGISAGMIAIAVALDSCWMAVPTDCVGCWCLGPSCVEFEGHE